MDRKRAIYLGLCAAIIGFALAFAFPSFSRSRVLWYYPLGHTWRFETNPSELAMDWYGRTLLAAIASAVAFLAGMLLGRRKVSDATLRLWAAWAVTAVALVMGLHVFQLVGRSPSPAPLPSWYVPR